MKRLSSPIRRVHLAVLLGIVLTGPTVPNSSRMNAQAVEAIQFLHTAFSLEALIAAIGVIATLSFVGFYLEANGVHREIVD